MKLQYLLFYALFLIYACGEESIPATEDESYKSYVNAEVGREWEYRYDSILYLNGGGNKVKSSGFMKVKIEEKQGEGLYSLSISFKKQENQPYQLQRLEKLELNEKTYLKTDQSLPFIHLVFPLEQGVKWDGNRLFKADQLLKINDEDMLVYGGWTYKLAKVDTSITFLSKSYPKSVVVEAGPSLSNLINRRFVQEIYSPSIGLVSRKFEVLNTQRIEPSTPWIDKAQSGFIYNQQLIAIK